MSAPWLIFGVFAIAGGSALAARFTRQHAPAAIGGGALILYLHTIVYFDYTSDDAYISYRYARNLADGLGLVWNVDERVEGYTNFLWVIVLAAAHNAGWDIVSAGRWMGFTLAIAGIGGTYVLARDLLTGEPGLVAAVAAALILAASGPYAVWAGAGLEGPLLAVLIVGAVVLHIRERESDRLPVSGAVWALAVMTRPDAAVLFAVSALFKLGEPIVRWRAERDRDRRPRIARPAALRLAIWLASFAAVFVPYFAWRYVTYDWLFPNTYYAKVGEGRDQYARGARYIWLFVREYGGALILLAPAAAGFAAIRRSRLLYVSVLMLAWALYVIYIGGDSLPRLRMLAPILPLFYAVVAAAGVALFQTIGRDRLPRWAVYAVASLAYAAMLLMTLAPTVEDRALTLERDAVADRIEIGRWLRRNTPPDTVIALVAAGAIPYESRLRTIDMVGLNDEHIAHRDLDLGAFAAGHEKYDTEYVLNRQPDIIILVPNMTGEPLERDDYDAMRASIIPAIADMVASERLWREYEPRGVRFAEDRWFNMLVRRAPSAVQASGEEQPVP